MIPGLLDGAGAGIIGIVLGIYERRQKQKADIEKFKQLRKVQNAEVLVNHLNVVADKPFFGISILMLVATICIATLICLNEPSRVLWTFDTSAVPKEIDFLFFHYKGSANKIYEITTGGIGYSLSQAMLVQVGRVISGVR